MQTSHVIGRPLTAHRNLDIEEILRRTVLLENKNARLKQFDKVSSFPEKKQKRLFRYAEDGRIETCYSKPRRANAFASFLEKKSTRLK
jgi:hypothetical protein